MMVRSSMPLPDNRSPAETRQTRRRRHSPSPQRRILRPRIPSPSSSKTLDGPAIDGPNNNKLTFDEIIPRLKRVMGPTPSCITNGITDHANQLMYFIDAREAIGVSYLWVLKIHTMTWEEIPVSYRLFKCTCPVEHSMDAIDNPLFPQPLPTGSKRITLSNTPHVGDMGTSKLSSTHAVRRGKYSR